MNYQEAREFIDQIQVRGSRPGLQAIKNLLELLGNPQDDLKFIHVAGTNGKGSVLAYLDGILREAGYLTGRYISPTLFSYRERIQAGGTYISREDFAEHTALVAKAMEEMEERDMVLPTVFEVETAIAFLHFRKMECDYVLLEAGMGGRMDATNIIRTPVLTVLTSISMDHMEYLGDTLEKIAWHKAGIMKRGIPVVSAHQEEEVAEVIFGEAALKGCRIVFVDPGEIREPVYGLEEQSFLYKDHGPLRVHLAGVHQLENAALAVEAADMLRYQGLEISGEQIRSGLERVVWKGRFTVLHREPYFVIDGAHNPDAARRLRASVEKYFADRKKYYIFGVFSDKEYDKIIDITADMAERIFTVETPDNPRALPAGKLAKAVARVNPSVEAVGDIREAVKKAYAAAGREDVILTFGSLSFLKEAEQAADQITGLTSQAEDSCQNQNETDGEKE